MPVRCRSRASICAMYWRPLRLRSRSSSSSGLKPERMAPPSAMENGGSSAMASRMRLATSGNSSRRSWMDRRRAACSVSNERLSAGILSSERPYSLAYQFAGYLEQRKAKGEKAYAFEHWEVLYTSDFIDALNRGWKFKDIEDAIDAAQATKHRFVCCPPLRLLENGESVMKLVYVLRRKGETLRQRLGEQYPSWYLENAGSHAVQEMKRAHEDEIAREQQQHEEELQRERELDEDVPILTLKTTGKFQCITPDCSYRFDTREQMHRHFDDCFAKAVEEMPTDPQDALDEEFADAFDDECGVLPYAIYPWFEEDEAEGRWEQYAPEK